MSVWSSKFPTGPATQRGVVLFISLVLLLVLTIISVSVVQTTSLEERMSRNSRDAALAFQSAEAALRDGENFLETVVALGPFDDVGTNGLWSTPVLGQAPRWETSAIWNDSRSAVAATHIDGVARQPRYIVEHIASVLLEENAIRCRTRMRAPRPIESKCSELRCRVGVVRIPLASCSRPRMGAGWTDSSGTLRRG